MKDCAKKISRTQTFSKLWVVRKVWHFIKREKKYMKYWQIGQIVYSHFLIENWKVKTFGTITAHINIEKLNERGKKRLNAKLERHLTRSHILLCEVFAYIYIYIYIYGLIWPFPSYSKQDFGIAWWRPQTRKSC